ncbi:MAG: hypothetical protein HYW05_05080 [Candidatus Diapherotrites archaeon]|nr:hypothetical protein [Candidatus Diapherotrites archaeon]
MPLLRLFGALVRRRGKAAHEMAPGALRQAQEAGAERMREYVNRMRGEEIEAEGERRLHKKMHEIEVEELRKKLVEFGFDQGNISEHINNLKTLKSLYENGLRNGNLWGAVNYAREQLGLEERNNEKMREKIEKILSDPAIATLLSK